MGFYPEMVKTRLDRVMAASRKQVVLEEMKAGEGAGTLWREGRVLRGRTVMDRALSLGSD